MCQEDIFGLYCPHLSFIWNWRKYTILLDTTASPSQSSSSVIDLFNAHFTANNSLLRIFQKADRVVIGNLHAEKGQNYRFEMTSTQSSSMSLIPLNPLWLGWNRWLKFFTSQRFHHDRNKGGKKGQAYSISGNICDKTQNKVEMWVATDFVMLGIYVVMQTDICFYCRLKCCITMCI